MATPAVPGAPAPAHEPRSRIGTAIGLAVTGVAIALAISFGMARSDDDARIVAEVVALHERSPESPPPGSLADSRSGGFPDHASVDGWVPIGAREREDVLSLVRWFRRRDPNPTDRLAYIRRAYGRWQRASAASVRGSGRRQTRA